MKEGESGENGGEGGDAEVAPGHLGQELAAPPAGEAAQAAHGGGEQQPGGGGDPGGLALRHRLHRPLLLTHHGNVKEMFYFMFVEHDRLLVQCE